MLIRPFLTLGPRPSAYLTLLDTLNCNRMRKLHIVSCIFALRGLCLERLTMSTLNTLHCIYFPSWMYVELQIRKLHFVSCKFTSHSSCLLVHNINKLSLVSAFVQWSEASHRYLNILFKFKIWFWSIKMLYQDHVLQMKMFS